MPVFGRCLRTRFHVPSGMLLTRQRSRSFYVSAGQPRTQARQRIGRKAMPPDSSAAQHRDSLTVISGSAIAASGAPPISKAPSLPNVTQPPKLRESPTHAEHRSPTSGNCPYCPRAGRKAPPRGNDHGGGFREAGGSHHEGRAGAARPDSGDPRTGRWPNPFSDQERRLWKGVRHVRIRATRLGSLT